MKFSNNLLYSIGHLSPLAHRLFLYLYSLPRVDVDNVNVKTDLPSIRRVLAMSDKHQNNHNIFSAIEELKQYVTLKNFKTLKAEYEQSDMVLVSAVSKLKQNNYRWNLEFTLNPKIIEIQEAGAFTPFSHSFFAKFKSAYSLKLFMLIYSHRKLTQRKIHLTHEQLCAALGADQNLKPSELKRRLKHAFLEIQASSTSVWMGEDDLCFDKRARVWMVEWQYQEVKKEEIKENQTNKINFEKLKITQFIALVRTMALTINITIPLQNGIIGVDHKGHLYNVATGQTFDKAKAGQLWRGLWQGRINIQKYLQQTKPIEL